MIECSSDRVPEKAPRWDLTGIEACGGGKLFLVCPLVYGEYLGIYEARIRVRGVPRGSQAWGRPPRARLPASWLPRLLLDVYSKSPGLRLFQKDLSSRFHSVWTLFDIPFLRITEIGKKTAIRAGPPVSRLVPKMI